MYRALALVAAAVLATGATELGGPTVDHQAGMTHGIFINEIAAELNPGGGYIELLNHSSSSIRISGWALFVCNTTITFDPLFMPPDTVLPPGGTYLIGDFNYSLSPPPDQQFDDPDEVLEQAGGGVALRDSTGVVLDAVMWGNPHPDCAFFPDAGVTPNDDQSLNQDPVNGGWFLVHPTPESSS